MKATDWISVVDHMPERDGEYLCWVNIPERHYNSARHSPAHSRYMALEFAEGGFWINGGLPKGMISHWMHLCRPEATAEKSAQSGGEGGIRTHVTA